MKTKIKITVETKEEALSKIKQNSYKFMTRGCFVGDRDVVLASAKKNPASFEFASFELRDDKDFIFELLNEKVNLPIEFVSPRLKMSKTFMSQVVKYVPNIFKFADISLKETDDKDFVLSLLKHNGLSFQYLSREWRADKDVVFAASNHNDYWISHVDENFVITKELAEKVIKQHYFAFKDLPLHFRSNKEMALFAVLQSGFNLENVSSDLQKDEDVVLVALQKDPAAIIYADKKYRSDKNWFLKAIQNNVNLYPAFSKMSLEIRSDKEIALLMVAKSSKHFQYVAPGLQEDTEVVAQYLQSYSKGKDPVPVQEIRLNWAKNDEIVYPLMLFGAFNDISRACEGIFSKEAQKEISKVKSNRTYKEECIENLRSLSVSARNKRLHSEMAMQRRAAMSEIKSSDSDSHPAKKRTSRI